MIPNVPQKANFVTAMSAGVVNDGGPVPSVSDTPVLIAPFTPVRSAGVDSSTQAGDESSYYRLLRAVKV